MYKIEMERPGSKSLFTWAETKRRRKWRRRNLLTRLRSVIDETGIKWRRTRMCFRHGKDRSAGREITSLLVHELV